MKKFLAVCAIFLFIIGLIIFYYIYVPLVPGFQLIIIPIFLLVFLLAVFHRNTGLLSFVFFFPLINSLPYFFHISEDTPHAPPALVLFLFFFLGWMINKAIDHREYLYTTKILTPLSILILLICISMITTFLRYTNFFPFCARTINEVIVNNAEVRAGGAIMSLIFSGLNYLTGFALFFVILQTERSKAFILKILTVLGISSLCVLLCGFLQKFIFFPAGISHYWIPMERINATLKDPNSFGCFLTAIIPISLALAISQKKFKRYLFYFILISSFFMIPFAGFRSGLFSLPLSLLLFIILVFQNTEKKRIQLVVTISLVMILILVFYFFVLDESPLISRFKLHFSQLLSGNIDEFLQGRLTLWKAAVTMIRNYPLAGVGVGAYIIELPNLGISQLSDSALNYFIQIGAELGAIGLLIFIWMYYSIFRKIIRGKKEIKGEKKEYRFIYIGLTCSLFSIFLNYLFHTFIGSFEMKYFFWLFLGVLFIYTKTEPVETKKKKKTKNIGLFVLTGFTLLLSWTSIHSLSLTKQEIKLDWNQNFGFYPEETGEEELPFRWSKKRAGFSIQFNSDRITIPIKASHPNIESAPVYVEFYSADRFFNKIKLIHTVQLRTTNWQKVFIQFERKMGKIDKILLEVSRTWQPMKELDSSDQRKLGIAVGKIEFDLHFPRA